MNVDFGGGGCSCTIGFDIDPNALEIAQENIDYFEVASSLELVRCDIAQMEPQNYNHNHQTKMVDTVIMNPPFGTKLKGIDMVFLEKAIQVYDAVVWCVALIQSFIHSIHAHTSSITHIQIQTNSNTQRTSFIIFHSLLSLSLLHSHMWCKEEAQTYRDDTTQFISLLSALSLSHSFIHTHTHMHSSLRSLCSLIHSHTHTHTHREREREREMTTQHILISLSHTHTSHTSHITHSLRPHPRSNIDDNTTQHILISLSHTHHIHTHTHTHTHTQMTTQHNTFSSLSHTHITYTHTHTHTHTQMTTQHNTFSSLSLTHITYTHTHIHTDDNTTQHILISPHALSHSLSHTATHTPSHMSSKHRTHTFTSRSHTHTHTQRERERERKDVSNHTKELM